MPANARVLLVVENDDFLDGLSAWISQCPGFEVAGIAHSAREAYERTFLLSPDIVLMDLSLTGSGLAATRLIKARAGAPLVVLMTFHDAVAVRDEAKAAGADACVSTSELTEAFPAIAGELWRARQAYRALPRTVNATRARDIES